jgi:hypothetical protein
MNFKKAVILLLSLLILGLWPSPALAWDDCPFGMVNDQYPGDCSRYIDTDNDSICDHSQPAPENRQAQIQTEENSAVQPLTATPAQTEFQQTGAGVDYNFPIISLVLIILYVASFGLVKAKKLSLITHRRIWNIGLGIAFILTAVLGLLLVLQVSYGIKISLPFQLLFWHVETGIVFALITVFHFSWHLPYYQACLKSNKLTK